MGHAQSSLAVQLRATERIRGLVATQDIGALGNVWDAIVGVKGDINVNDKWYMPYYADVGAGDSDLTWQAESGVGYRFDWGDVSLSYRYMDWNFKSGDKLDDLNAGGPVLAAKFRF